MPDNFQLQGWWAYKTTSVTIGSAGTVSSTADLEVTSLCGVITPSVLSQATMNFQVSNDGTTFYPLYDYTNTLVALTVGTALASAYYVDPTKFLAYRYVQAKMGGAEAAARTLVFVSRPM